MKILRKLLVIFLLLTAILISSVFGISYYTYYKAKEELPVADVLDEIKSTTSNYTVIEDVDKDFLNAIVAVEDRRFYTREGIDFISLARAIVVNLTTGSMQEGGSTITQQVAKNVYFGYDRDLFEKLAEYFFIYDLEDAYSKDEILEIYINIINYGDGNFNIYDATVNYFEKTPDDLTIYEAALLAGIPNSPANYQLSNDNPNTYKRQTHVLECMLEEGYIDKEQFVEAIAQQP